MSQFPYPIFPNSWFQVAWSNELAVGQVNYDRWFRCGMRLWGRARFRLYCRRC